MTYRPVNVGELADFEPQTEITPEVLSLVGFLKKPTDPVVILGEGELNVALRVKAHRFSKSAIEKIQAAGGEIEVIPLAS